MPTREQIEAALAKVDDPEIRRPITDLGMVKDITIDGAAVHVDVYLTVAGCPMRDEITGRVTRAVEAVDGVGSVTVGLDVMSEEQRKAMRRLAKLCCVWVSGAAFVLAVIAAYGQMIDAAAVTAGISLMTAGTGILL